MARAGRSFPLHPIYLKGAAAPAGTLVSGSDVGAGAALIGYPIVGATKTSDATNDKRGSLFTPALSYMVDSGWCWVGLASGTGTQLQKMVVYRADTGALVAISNELTLTEASIGWQKFTFTPFQVTAGVSYWVCQHVGTTTGTLVTQFAIDNVGTATYFAASGGDLYTDGPSDPIGTNGTGAPNRTMSIYLSAPEVAALTATIPGTDSGSGADASALTAQLSDSDTGTGSDSGVVSGATTSVAGTDSGSGADSSSLTATYVPTDTGAGADASGETAQIPGTDTGAGSENGTLRLIGADTGTGADTSSLAAQLPGTDAGTGADASALVVQIAASDTGTGADNAIVTTGSTPVGSDVGTGTDTATVRFSPAVTDTGTGADSATLQSLLAGSDTASGADSAVRAVSSFGTDTGAGTESAALAALLSSADTATGTDSAAVVKPIVYIGAFPGPGTYPDHSGIRLSVNGTTSLSATALAVTHGVYPRSYPRSYPGHGTDLTLSLPPTRPLVVTPA